MTFTPKKVLFSTGTIATGYFWATTDSFFRIQDIEIDQNDNVYIGGQIGSTSQLKPYFGQYDLDLNINWGRYRNTYGSNAMVNVIRTGVSDSGSSDDDVWVQGFEAVSNGSDNYYPTLTRFNDSGTVNQDRRYNQNDYIKHMDLHPTENQVVMVGKNFSNSQAVAYTTNLTGGNAYRNTQSNRGCTGCVITKKQGESPRAVYGADRDGSNQNFSFGKVWSVGQNYGSHVSGAIGDYEQFCMSPEVSNDQNWNTKLYGFGRESGEHVCILVWLPWINSGDSNTLQFARGYRFDDESSPEVGDCMYVEDEAGNGTDYVYSAFATANSGWVTKHSANGGLIWARRFRGSNSKLEKMSIASDSFGDVWVAGYGTFNGSSNRGFIAKIPPNGDYTGTYGDLDYSNYSSLSQKTGISRQSNSGGNNFNFSSYSQSNASTSFSSISRTISQEDGLK